MNNTRIAADCCDITISKSSWECSESSEAAKRNTTANTGGSEQILLPIRSASYGVLFVGCWYYLQKSKRFTSPTIPLSRLNQNKKENKRLQALDADSHSADILRRRAAVIGFRAGMLCYLMEGRQNKKQIGEFAEWVAEYTFRTQMAIFGEKLEEEISQGLEMATAKGAVESLLDLLPSEFDKSDLIALRVKRKQSTSPNAIRIVLHRWKKAGKIEQVDGLAKYRQLKKN